MSYSDVILADSPIRYYRLGEAEYADPAVDETGTEDAAYAGGGTGFSFAQAGLIDSDPDTCVKITGSPAFVMCKAGGVILAGQTDWTIEIWVKTTDTGTAWELYTERQGSGGPDVLTFGSSSAAKIALQLVYRDDAGTLDVITGDTISALSDGVKHYLRCTKTGSTIKFYVDDVHVGGGTLTATDTFTHTGLVDCCIARDNNNGVTVADTFIDEVALYATALSEARGTAHYAAATAGGEEGSPPENTGAPLVSGTTVVGHELATTDGTWTDDGDPTFSYQWQRDSGGDLSFDDIDGATASTYTLVGDDLGNNVRCVVTDTDSVDATSANSNAVGLITESGEGGETGELIGVVPI